MNKTVLFLLIIQFSLLSCTKTDSTMPDSKHNLVFGELADRWDEAIPLGNGMLGCLIWEREGKLRLSLDRADLWDLRPLE